MFKRKENIIEKDPKSFSITEVANRACLIIMTLTALITGANAYITISIKEGLSVSLITLPAIFFVYILIKKTSKDSLICAYVIPLVIFFGSIFYIFLRGGCTQAITLLSISCLMASLYFNTKVILTLSTCSLASTFLLQIVLPNGILGPNLDTGTFITFAVFEIITLVILCCSSIWGNKV